MSASRDEKSLPDLEAAGKAYRDAGFDDEPPAHVDAFIRAAARRESKRKLNDYLPAFAVAATIVLALGLVLRLTLPGRDLVTPAGAPATMQEPARIQERAAPAQDSAAPAVDVVPAPGIAAEQAVQLEEVVTRARASAADAESAATAPPGPTATDIPELRGVASTAASRMAAPAQLPAACAPPEREDPDLWLACIEAQIGAGLLDAARAELTQFRAAFAAYPVPANITEALEP